MKSMGRSLNKKKGKERGTGFKTGIPGPEENSFSLIPVS